jgi:hypothetical protein
MGYCFTYYGPWGSTGFAGPFDTYEQMINHMVNMQDEEWEDQTFDIIEGHLDFEELCVQVYKIEVDGPFTGEEQVIKGWIKNEEEWQKYRKKQEEESEHRQYERLKKKYEK